MGKVEHSNDSLIFKNAIVSCYLRTAWGILPLNVFKLSHIVKNVRII